MVGSYVKKLAAEAGLDPDVAKAVPCTDKKRKDRRISNEDWVNPHDSEVKVSWTNDWACDRAYKPEHLTDLESGAIIWTEARVGDAHGSEGPCERVLEGCATLARVREDPKQEKVDESFTTDEDFISLEEICASRRRKEKQRKVTRQTLCKTRVAVESKSGKALLRKCEEHLERAFASALDQGGHEAGEPALDDEPDQTADLRGTRLRPLALDAQALRVRDTQTMDALQGLAAR